MKFLTKEELFSSTGIGASDVAAICHESPFMSAFTLWTIKTGRAPKPPQTEAMKAGVELEANALEAFKEHILLDREIEKDTWEDQVICQSEAYPFLRTVADGWNWKHREGVNVKSPTSDKLLLHPGIPRYYLLQYAAEMFCFEAETWWQYVYMPNRPGRLDKITWKTPFDSSGITLQDFWTETALPAIEAFWNRLEASDWLDVSGPEIQGEDWLLWHAQADEADLISQEASSLEDEAKAHLKRLIGQRKAYEAAGYKCRWQHSKPRYAVTVVCETEEAMARTAEFLLPLNSVEGVREVKTDVRRENYAFYVENSKEENDAR